MLKTRFVVTICDWSPCGVYGIEGPRGDKIDGPSMGSLLRAHLLCAAWAVKHVKYNRVRLVIFDSPLPLGIFQRCLLRRGWAIEVCQI
jgi:hypothetical protein